MIATTTAAVTMNAVPPRSETVRRKSVETSEDWSAPQFANVESKSARASCRRTMMSSTPDGDGARSDKRESHGQGQPSESRGVQAAPHHSTHRRMLVHRLSDGGRGDSRRLDTAATGWTTTLAIAARAAPAARVATITIASEVPR